MESDLHQVIKANDDLTPEHFQFFLYQLLRALKYIHTGTAHYDYVATRWYRAPELCGSFFSKYTPAIDIWSIGCIFAELLTGKPLFPGKNVVHQLELMTDLLGTPSPESIAKVRNEKARRYLGSMRKKQPMPLSAKCPNADPLAVKLMEKMLAFDPTHRPTAEEALADPYFKGLAKVEREPAAQPITKVEFEFERRRLNMDDVRELIYREILEYHPQMLKDFLNGTDPGNFLYPSAVDQFRRQFHTLEEHYGKAGDAPSLERQHASLPRERVAGERNEPRDEAQLEEERRRRAARQQRAWAQSGYKAGAGQPAARPGRVVGSSGGVNGAQRDDVRRYARTAALSAQSPFHIGSQLEDSTRKPARQEAGAR
ncbi:unnamed protein product [Closterium sp. Naga37s-1]|nr:unnamed protein product [Closterium sp. Naga37s-1]